MAAYAAGAFLWPALGERVPGGRWFAIHLFTLGVLSNLVMALSHHFASTLLQVPDPPGRDARFALLNVGALAILGGFPIAPVLIAGGVTVTAAVAWLLWDLRRMRASALQGQFAFVVRSYERAATAFLLGALLGVLMGTGVLSGTWYVPGRFAHLHLNVLGWGGLTLLATVVFFGPTILRVPAQPDAPRTAARALDAAAIGLLVAASGLLLMGTGEELALRLAAASGLALYAGGATVVCLGVLRAGRRAEPSARARFVLAACLWFSAVMWAEVGVLATGELRLLDALGAALLAGTLGQAILAALAHLASVISAGSKEARAALSRRLEWLPRLRPALLNLAVLCVVGAAVAGQAAGTVGTVLARVGWGVIAAVSLSQLWLTAVSIRAYRLQA